MGQQLHLDPLQVRPARKLCADGGGAGGGVACAAERVAFAAFHPKTTINHCSRRALTGSRPDALRAGSQHASAEMLRKSAVMQTYVVTSVDLIPPTSRAEITRPRRIDPMTP